MYMQSPDKLTALPDVFLAGGISNCPDWQTRVGKALSNAGLYVANPRRRVDIDWQGPEAAEQIAWEYEALNTAHTVLFWFPKESVCPIALFELGVQIGRARVPILVGAEEGYTSIFDLETQMKLAEESTPLLDQTIYTSLTDLAEASALACGVLMNPYTLTG